MKIGIDISPLTSGHKIRGVGFYVENLKEALVKYCSQHEYIFYTNKLKEFVDIVHYPYFDPFFITFPIRKKVPTIITVHDLTPLTFPKLFPSGMKGKAKWNINKLVLKNANAIITDSVASKDDVVRTVGISESKVTPVYLAAGEEFKKLEIGNWKLEIVKRYQLPDRFVLYVGDVTPNKNLPRLLEALEGTDIHLVMVGKSLADKEFDASNPWNADLVKVQSLAKDNKNIHILGFLPKEDLIGLYNMATLLVLPSLYEGFGLTILEAMQSGTPVVTTKEGSLQEVAGDAAFFVDSYNTESIKRGIETVFNDVSLQKELIKKGFEQAKKFSWKKCAQETVKVYESIKL